ncbi:MAG: hypothetical protein AVDCRST_MAG68-2434 [uncultured Gemmatimonadetes bacterium]|uniref:Uncharacterized protein n=1 Tax=uncultured Gemmatimonadota bacterium TaxID=203437 RepID=A0A6J4LGQ0_9BACT|nr:MAG: hypothetical protein AVDCRST_MAG68-2434 [uncultured Gemmatimonadota bacterium]
MGAVGREDGRIIADHPGRKEMRVRRGGPHPPDPPLPITGEGGDFHGFVRRAGPFPHAGAEDSIAAPIRKMRPLSR